MKKQKKIWWEVNNGSRLSIIEAKTVEGCIKKFLKEQKLPNPPTDINTGLPKGISCIPVNGYSRDICVKDLKWS